MVEVIIPVLNFLKRSSVSQSRTNEPLPELSDGNDKGRYGKDSLSLTVTNALLSLNPPSTAAPLVAGSPVLPLPEYKEVNVILELLAAAKERIRTQISKAEEELKKNAEAGDKIKLKKRLETLRERLATLESKLQNLYHLSPAARKKITGQIAMANKTINNLSSAAGKIADDTLVSANTLGEIETLLKTAETSISAIEKQIPPMRDLSFLTGRPDWYALVYSTSAVNDGVIQYAELSPEGKRIFRELGLIVDNEDKIEGIAADGLTKDELRRIVQAKKEFFIMLGEAALSGAKKTAGDVFRQMLLAAARGELTLARMREILKPFKGIEVNSEAFAVLFKGAPRSNCDVGDGKVNGIEGFCRSMDNLFISIQINSNRIYTLEDLANMRENGREKDRLGVIRELSAAFRAYIGDTDGTGFAIVKLDVHQSLFREALLARLKLSNRMTPEKLWNKLLDESGPHSPIMDDIDKMEVSSERKWELLTIAYLQKIRENLANQSLKGTDEEKQKEAAEKFYALMEKVQNGRTGGEARTRYVAGFSAVFLNGAESVFDLNRILDAKEDETIVAVPIAVEAKAGG